MATTLSAGAEVPIRSQSVRTPRRPPTTARAEQPLPRSESSSRADSSRPHRRSSQRSTSGQSPRHDMPPPAANNAGPSEEGRDGADSKAAQRTAKHRYRTVIPAPSGNYAFIKTIGQGSMGKVKLAKKEGSNELASHRLIPLAYVACKIIERVSPEDGRTSREEREKADSAREDRNAREAAIVSLLNHQYICGLRDNLRTRWHWYMLFEYVNGGQMLDYIISHGKLKEKQARKFARQIASAVDYCHRNSIVHRDLKIENILISKTGDIKIIDFGLSNLFCPDEDRKLKTYCGSLYFAAPELLQAKPYTGPEVDVWSFGVVLFVLVCGKVPFDDQYMPALHQKIKKGAVDYPNWLSTECKHLISRMLVTDPRQRATMHEVMNHPWMLKGYGGPPDNYLPHREPLSLPLDPEIISHMTGFKFGPPEYIQTELTKKIKSPKYQAAVRRLEKEKDLPQPAPKDVEKRRGFGFDFYKRRNSVTSKDTLTNTSSEGLPIGDDPLNAFDPMISIYYLVREKLERERKDLQAPPKAQPPPPSPQIQVPIPPSPVVGPKAKHSLAEIVPPQPAHTDSRSRQRTRSHSEDQAREPAKNGLLSPDMMPVKKESTAAGILRRLSTRDRRKEPAVDGKSSTFTRGSVSMRAKSLGHARRESIQARRAKREAEAREQQPVKEETDAELGDGEGETGETSGGSNDRLTPEDPDLAKPVYLKGIFSVSTTSTKPLPEIRSDIKRVLKQLGVDYNEIKGGFSCAHAPSIVEDTSQLQPVAADGEIKFEILIVKVPIVSLHGVQFKRVGGNTWQYKAMAEQIVRELRL
ncbi:kinase-like domain-containing protein [Apodospora peruviana]|uniref:non-specific serine/threonine protein kinase n=1 Tax=Apodospora peruviana TaxID=516989 RepID=A0AAE0M239_9PEZI|nr:kinase-like domain-containing protein [Apodospora peruviana]